MHQGVVDWTRASVLPEMVQGARVLDVGSADWNGSLRGWFMRQGASEYHGIDIIQADGVTEVLSANDLLERHGSTSWDLILCLEMLEHCEHWQDALYQMKASLKVGGWLLLTTRAQGYPFHAPPDRWRFSKSLLRWYLSDLEAVETWSDPGFYVSETVHSIQPGVFIRGRRAGDVRRIDTPDAEPAPPDPGEQDDVVSDPRGFAYRRTDG